MRSICVYCGSNTGADPAFEQATTEFARLLAEQGTRVVYGGGAVGLMGALADAALAAGGEVVGVIPQALMDREIGHKELTTLHVVATMHERKALMAELADGFAALPGGIGTLEELIEMYTWAQLELHRKPIGVLNTNGYYDRLAAFLDQAVESRFLRAEQRAALAFAPDPAALLAHLRQTARRGAQ